MGLKVHCESLFLGYHHSMRDLNNESNGCRLPLFYGDNKTSANDQSYNGFPSQSTRGYDKEVVRRTMLEHEAVFKTQVLELHRVYMIQKDMMDELKRKQLGPIEPSSQLKFPLTNSVYDRPSMSVVEDNGHSPMKGVVGPWKNGASSKNVEMLEVRPTKLRKKMIDLCLPADDYIDETEEVVELKDHMGCGGTSSQLANGDVKPESRGDNLRNRCGLSSRSNGLADLNEPLKAQEANEFAYGHFHDLSNGEYQGNKHVPVIWRERTFIDLEADTDTNTCHEVYNPHQPRHLYPYNPLDSAVQWNHLHNTSQNRSFGFPQKVVSAQRYPILNLSNTLSGNVQKQGCLGDRLQFESNSRFNSEFGNTSRFNHNECSSSSKPKFSVTGCNYPFMDSNGSEKFARDLNLNVTLSNTSVVDVRKDEEHLATLPWLIKPKSNSEMADGKWNLKSNGTGPSSLKPLDIKGEAGNKVQNLMSEKDKVHKVMMLDINEPCEPLSDEDQQAEEQTETKVSGSNRCQFDLNMTVSEAEDGNWSVPTSSRLNSKVHIIDLEAPAVPESDDDISGTKPSEETPIEEKLAAETIVAISSACLDRELEVIASAETPETIILHWFAETVDTYMDDLDKELDTLSRNQACSIEEIDYFESMTLQLPEITEEEYMPKLVYPEDLKMEEPSGATLVISQRPRRGNARKAKQRRDFQRDILPGLLSLSKHEVREDIQMFDGFMRAAGRTWTLTRKKTGLRGRPRRIITIPEPGNIPPAPPKVQQHVSNESNNGETELSLEDRRFADWGKMTRRPRRQRCPSTAINQRSSPHAPLT